MGKNILKLTVGILFFVFLTGFFGAKGDTPAEKRRAINKMRQEVLAELYRLVPSAKAELRRAEGYAVFSNIGINVFIVSTGNGYGVAHDNRTGKDIYMRMISGGVGVGFGVKDFRGIFVFYDRKAFHDFVEYGWTAHGQADAAAKLSETGGALSAAIEVAPGVRLYQLTENGLAAQATIQGSKYWKDDELN